MMALERGQHVLLRPAVGGAPVPAQVEATDGEILTLVLSVRPAPGAPGWGDGRAIVEYTTRRGVHRAGGTVLVDPAQPEVLRLRHDGQPEVLQRRNFVRVDAVVPVQVKITDPLRGSAHTTTLNVSGGGMLFRDPIGLPFGARVEVVVELAAGSAPVRAVGRIAREVSDEVKGMEIVEIGRDDRERLIRYVTERERMALRIARGA